MNPVDPAQRHDRSASGPGVAGGHSPATCPQRRGFLLRGIGAAGLSGVSTAIYATAIEPVRLVTTSYRFTPPRWSAGPMRVADRRLPCRRPQHGG